MTIRIDNNMYWYYIMDLDNSDIMVLGIQEHMQIAKCEYRGYFLTQSNLICALS